MSRKQSHKDVWGTVISPGRGTKALYLKGTICLLKTAKTCLRLSQYGDQSKGGHLGAGEVVLSFKVSVEDFILNKMVSYC